MKIIKIKKSLDIIDYVAEHPDFCKGRKILTDAKMVEKVSNLTDICLNEGKTTIFSIVCPETGNLTEVTFVKESENCFWLKEILAEDIEPIGEIDHSKEPICITNAKQCEKCK